MSGDLVSEDGGGAQGEQRVAELDGTAVVANGMRRCRSASLRKAAARRWIPRCRCNAPPRESRPPPDDKVVPPPCSRLLQQWSGGLVARDGLAGA